MESVIDALESIKEQGSFCGMQTTSMDNLKIEIKEFGPLKLPLSVSKAKALIKHAKPAKFGWRDQTVLDKTVRHAWEISKSHIKIDGALWNKKLKSVLDMLKHDLGLPDNATLKANLHNLLIYEPGQFFSAHQDSEKCDGMVASLVIVIPSVHHGGSLVIDHQGEKKQFQTSRFALDKLTYIAFYADCHHEVKEVKDGYRVTLTYNLILKNNDEKINIPSKTKSNDELIQALRTYFMDDPQKELARRQKPKQFIYLLDHNYTQKGLSWSRLKNGDHLRAEALKVAANILDLEIHMALADVQETWDCETDYDPYEYRRRRKYRYWNDDEEEDDEPNEDSVMVNDLIDSNTVLKHWINQKNEPLDYKDCHMSSSQIGWTKSSDEFEPFQSEYEGYMGNYGNTLDRWYHRAAIVLWQKKDHYPILFQMDSNSVISELLNLSKKKFQEEHVRYIVSSLLPFWSDYLRRDRESEGSVISTVFKLALYVKTAQLAQNMIANFDIKVLTPERTTLFLSLQEAYGIPWCLTILKEWTTSKERWATIPKCEKISEIIKAFSENNGDRELIDWLLDFQLGKIKEQDESYKNSGTRASIIESLSDRFKETMGFINACVIAHHDSIYINFLNHMTNHKELYPALELVKIIEFLQKSLRKDVLAQWRYQSLFDHVHHEILKEQHLGLRDKNDWSISENPTCQCEDCVTLSEFLQSNTIHMKWPMGKDRRAHIHQAIDRLAIPVTHKTEHTGSPHKLILVKTDQLHVQAKKRFDRLSKALLHLSEMNQEKINCLSV